MKRRTKWLIACASVFATAVAGIAVHRAVRMIQIGVAYKAKAVCSAVFVSRRGWKTAASEYEIDDLAILRQIRTSIDHEARSVTATAAGIITRRAFYRDGLGCALALDGLTPPRLPRHDAVHLTETTPMERSPAWPPFDAVEPPKLQGVVAHAFAEPNATRPRRTQAVVILHRGKIVAERYAPGIGPDSALAGWSMTKSVMNALVGVLVKDGRLKLGAPVPVPEWQSPGDPRRSITLDELLRMSSGLAFDEDMENPLADVTQMLFRTGDAAGYAIVKPLMKPPGTEWRYSSGTTNIISRIIRNVLANDAAYLTLPRRALFERIGMTSAVMETDATGTFVGSSFMYATARDWARFGTLYLQGGVWAGERILPEGWVAYTTTPAPADRLKHYGAGFWLDVPDEYRERGIELPRDAFHAAGHEAQFVTIVPSRETVIVRLGRTRYADAWDHSAFVRDVLNTLVR